MALSYKMWKVRKRDSRTTDRKATAIFGLDMPTTRTQSDASPSAGLMAERDIHLQSNGQRSSCQPLAIQGKLSSTSSRVGDIFGSRGAIVPSLLVFLFFPHATAPLVPDHVSNLFSSRRASRDQAAPS